MNNTSKTYHGRRFPIEIIGYSVWLYHRFTLSFRDVEELLAELGITDSYETVRQWCRKFGPEYARRPGNGKANSATPGTWTKSS